MRVKCDCIDWQMNVVDQIDDAIRFVINKFGPETYNIKRFEYCPYCGKKVEEAS